MAHHSVALLQSWIEVNCMQSTAVGKAARLSIDWQEAAYCSVISEWQVKFAQLYKYHQQSGERQASLKAALGV